MPTARASSRRSAGRGAGRIVGHVCIEPDEPASAEVAVAVADELQGRGIGRALVEAAVEWARRDGFATLTATMLADNPAIQRLLTGLGLPTTTRADRGRGRRDPDRPRARPNRRLSGAPLARGRLARRGRRRVAAAGREPWQRA